MDPRPDSVPRNANIYAFPDRFFAVNRPLYNEHLLGSLGQRKPLYSEHNVHCVKRC
jgi:hypothetical protein